MEAITCNIFREYVGFIDMVRKEREYYIDKKKIWNREYKRRKAGELKIKKS